MTSKTLATKIADASVAVGALATDKRNAQQGYDYISADKILERCGDALAHAGVILIPAITAADVLAVETRTSRGDAIRYDADVSFAMTLSDGETTLEFPWRGRGSDYAVPDKALYKAITSGHKYFLMKLLNVGVGNEDGEHEAVEAPQRPAQRTQPPAARNTTRAAAAPRSAPENGISADVDLGMGESSDNPFDGDTPAANDPQEAERQTLLRKLHAIGHDLYGDKWDSVRHKNVRRFTGQRTESSKEMTIDELSAMIAGMEQLQAKRAAQPA